MRLQTLVFFLSLSLQWLGERERIQCMVKHFLFIIFAEERKKKHGTKEKTVLPYESADSGMQQSWSVFLLVDPPLYLFFSSMTIYLGLDSLNRSFLSLQKSLTTPFC
jgi:hypothetical protein